MQLQSSTVHVCFNCGHINHIVNSSQRDTFYFFGLKISCIIPIQVCTLCHTKTTNYEAENVRKEATILSLCEELDKFRNKYGIL